MASPRLTKLFIEAMAKHLPPSAAALRLIDVNGAAGDTLSTLRADLDLVAVNGDQWTLETECADAVVAYGRDLDHDLLGAAMKALRPGGRLVVVNPYGSVDEERVKQLESAGYTRILVETGIECPLPTGVLMRGEKPHVTTDTLERIQLVASKDDEAVDFNDYKGRYIHLLIVQTPNKPVWALSEGETVQWQAVTVNGAMLAFSSLPKAVAFMQPAVLAGTISGVHKVAKFSKATAQGWTQPVMLNPAPEILVGQTMTLVNIDATTAETPDE